MNANELRVFLTMCLIAASISSSASPLDGRRDGHRSRHPERFSFALIGDLPYDARQEGLFPNLLEDINRDRRLAFTIHDGDFKGGSSRCDDAIYLERRELFERFEQPFIYVFGDNEWTDCHRPNAGGYDPFERLARLRQIFAPYASKESLGHRRLHLERQDERFPENLRWMRGGVVFAGLHVVGSNNGLRTASQYLERARTEYAARNAANLEWLESTFRLAREENALGLMLIIQANPWDLIPPAELTGFQDFLGALERETRSFAKPVVLVHGDSHYFRIDKPLPTPPFDATAAFPPLPWESSEPRLENFTRVETFGNPNVHWIKATIDPGDPNVFSFKPVIVEKNRAAGVTR
jgi:hypothetical protein